ncbi:hypothetical protein ANTRET_LOCUS9165 [Anthophora retusa]
MHHRNYLERILVILFDDKFVTLFTKNKINGGFYCNVDGMSILWSISRFSNCENTKDEKSAGPLSPYS